LGGIVGDGGDENKVLKNDGKFFENYIIFLG
jgi:hypothetical protein